MTKSPSTIHVRDAAPADGDVIVEYNRRLAEETEGMHLARERIVPGVDAVLADPRKGRYYLACAGGEIVGQVMITYEWSDWRNGWIWWLQSVYVAAGHRRRGVFRRLFEHVQQRAEAEPDVVGLRLYVENGNARAQETYVNLGMRPAGYHVLERMFDRR